MITAERTPIESVNQQGCDRHSSLPLFSASVHAPRLGWGQVSLGECALDAGPQNMTVVASGSAGQNGIACHLGLDTLMLRSID
jgi:hypothetical protein